MTVSQIKGSCRNPPQNKIPREGTKIRAIYDLFYENRGHAVKFTRCGKHSRYVESLIDYYGLDILPLGRGKYILVGEWFGKIYMDYMGEGT